MSMLRYIAIMVINFEIDIRKYLTDLTIGQRRGHFFSVLVTLLLLFCFCMVISDLNFNNSAELLALFLLILFTSAAAWVLWAVQLDISIARLKKNFPKLFKQRSGGLQVQNLLILSDCFFATRFLPVPTQPPRFCLAFFPIARLFNGG